MFFKWKLYKKLKHRKKPKKKNEFEKKFTKKKYLTSMKSKKLNGND